MQIQQGVQQRRAAQPDFEASVRFAELDAARAVQRRGPTRRVERDAHWAQRQALAINRTITVVYILGTITGICIRILWAAFFP